MSKPSIYTYFIQNESGDAVKIGISKSPEQRLRNLQTAHHQKLKIVAIVEGNREEEFHARFKKSKLRGEWFKVDPEMAAYLQSQGAHFSTEGYTPVKKVREIRKPVDEMECDIALKPEEFLELVTYNPFGPCEECSPEEPGIIRWEPEDEDDDGYCDCDCPYNCWDLFFTNITEESRILIRIGLNTDAKILWLVMKDINSGVRADEFNGILDRMYYIREIGWAAHITYRQEFTRQEVTIRNAEWLSINTDFRLNPYSRTFECDLDKIYQKVAEGG